MTSIRTTAVANAPLNFSYTGGTVTLPASGASSLPIQPRNVSTTMLDSATEAVSDSPSRMPGPAPNQASCRRPVLALGSQAVVTSPTVPTSAAISPINGYQYKMHRPTTNAIGETKRATPLADIPPPSGTFRQPKADNTMHNNRAITPGCSQVVVQSGPPVNSTSATPSETSCTPNRIVPAMTSPDDQRPSCIVVGTSGLSGAV